MEWTDTDASIALAAEYAEATRVKVPATCPECGSTALVLITPLIAGPDGWARRCKACGHRWDVADEA